MGFNYGLEKRKFTEEWKKLYREYKAAGMSEEDIQDIYAFDLNVFRKIRTEFQRTQPLSESSCDDGIEQSDLCLPYSKSFPARFRCATSILSKMTPALRGSMKWRMTNYIGRLFLCPKERYGPADADRL